MQIYRLENWSVICDNPYLPPESQRAYLAGKVYDHPKYDGGHKISTSRIISSEGRLVTTYSGSIYELGEVNPDYLVYLNKGGRTLDELNPIKVISNDLTSECPSGKI